MPRTAYGGRGPAAPKMRGGDGYLHMFRAWPSEGHLPHGCNPGKPVRLSKGYVYDGRPLPERRTSLNDLSQVDAFSYSLHLGQISFLREYMGIPWTNLSLVTFGPSVTAARMPLGSLRSVPLVWASSRYTTHLSSCLLKGDEMNGSIVPSGVTTVR